MVKKALLTGLAGLILSVSGCSVYDRKEIQYSPPTTNNAYILLGKPNRWYDYLRAPFEGLYFGPVKDALKEEGAKSITLTKNYDTIDFYHAIENPNNKRVVFTGHGNWSGITWPDNIKPTLDEYELGFYTRYRHINPKQLVIRHTCGSTKTHVQKKDGLSVHDKKYYPVNKKQLDFLRRGLKNIPVKPTKVININHLGKVSYDVIIENGSLKLLLVSEKLNERYRKKEKEDLEKQRTKIYNRELHKLLELKKAKASSEEIYFQERRIRAHSELELKIIDVENAVFKTRGKYKFSRGIIGNHEIKVPRSKKRELGLAGLALLGKYFEYPIIHAFIKGKNGLYPLDFYEKVEKLNVVLEKDALATATKRMVELIDTRLFVYNKMKTKKCFGDPRFYLKVKAEDNFERLVMQIYPDRWEDKMLDKVMNQFYQSLGDHVPGAGPRKRQFGECLVGGDLSKIRGWDEIVSPIAFMIDPVPEPLGNIWYLGISDYDKNKYEQDQWKEFIRKTNSIRASKRRDHKRKLRNKRLEGLPLEMRKKEIEKELKKFKEDSVNYEKEYAQLKKLFHSKKISYGTFLKRDSNLRKRFNMPF